MDEHTVRRFVETWVERPMLRRIEGGMNSEAWLVETSAPARYVVKVADASAAAGLDIADALEQRGLRAGAPVARAAVGDQVVALLRFVAGVPLERSDAELIGEVLGRAHSLLAGVDAPDAIARWPWDWLDVALIGEPDLRERARAALDAAESVAPTVTHGLLHGDPAPEAFLADGREMALIDWGSALHGPLLYDVASAVMYAGRRVLAGYARTGPVRESELERVDVFLAFRWAVQAWYFAWRIANDVLTGVGHRRENDKGLADARAALCGSGGV